MSGVETISDPADPRIADYLAVRERDLAGREGRFVAEGEVVLHVLLERSRHAPVSILVAENRVARLAPLLAKAPAGVPIYAASQPVMDRIVGFPIHRGILAIGRRAPEPDACRLLAGLPDDAVAVALFGIANHDNMGGIFRNAAAFGAAAVILDFACCDPLYRKAIRVSVGATLVVPFVRLDRGADVVAFLAGRGFRTLALSPSGDTALADFAPGGRTAVLLGTEGPGLPHDVLGRLPSIRIPMAPGFDSLNVATASGIVLYQLTRRS